MPARIRCCCLRVYQKQNATVYCNSLVWWSHISTAAIFSFRSLLPAWIYHIYEHGGGLVLPMHWFCGWNLMRACWGSLCACRRGSCIGGDICSWCSPRACMPNGDRPIRTHVQVSQQLRQFLRTRLRPLSLCRPVQFHFSCLSGSRRLSMRALRLHPPLPFTHLSLPSHPICLYLCHALTFLITLLCLHLCCACCCTPPPIFSVGHHSP